MALKFLTSDALLSGEAVARFAREARAAVKIKSEHVARVIDVGTLETGAPYMVMEYLQGRDLSQLLSARGRLPVEEAVEYVLQACEALAEAHVLRDRPSRSQAGEPVLDPARRRHRCHQGARLRHLQSRCRAKARLRTMR